VTSSGECGRNRTYNLVISSVRYIFVMSPFCVFQILMSSVDNVYENEVSRPGPLSPAWWIGPVVIRL
jgi:hypothetical protein